MKEEEYLTWRADPVTQEYLEILRLWREALKEQWARGEFNSDIPNETAIMNAGALREIACLNKLIDLDFEDIKETFDGE